VTRLGGIGWIALVLATLAVAIAPDLVSLPRPTEALVVDRATLLVEGRPAREVSLPDVFFRHAGDPSTVRYRVDVDPSTLPDVGAALYVPLVNRRAVVSVDGETINDSADHAVWAGLALTTPLLVRLPQRPPGSGPYRLTLEVEPGPFASPTYVSRFYLGSDAALAPSFKWRHLLDVDFRIVSLATQLLLAAGVLLAWLARPHGVLLSWLAGLLALTIVVDIGMFLGFRPGLWPVLPYIVAVVPAWGLIAVAVSLQLLDVPPPKALLVGIVVLTAVLLVCAAIGTPLARIVVAAAAAAGICVGAVVASCIIAWGALWRGNPDARIMLAPAVLISWFLLRDAYVAATLPDHAFRLYSPQAGLLYVVGLCAVLVRRMADSFDRLDRSNEVLNARLAEREAELAALARQERIEGARLVREQERGRLTRDLHDGISGHLVSIIALSERAETRPIEQAARDALSDLRLVIYSLDIGEDELPLALANFRERLEPQLQRLGVALDWSMADLPDVAGVTPGNALAVLRIVQEAITNALKHGPARRIAVRGRALADGCPVIMVDNDGRPFAADSRGRGLDNMRRRAGLLDAALTLEALPCGTRVVLALPRRLPDLES
jgi:signal transduction histidine kinase